MQQNNLKVVPVSKSEYDNCFTDYHYSLFLVSSLIESVAFNNEVVYLHFIKDGAIIAKLSGLSEKGSRLIGNSLFLYAAPALLVDDEGLYNECLYALLKYAKRAGFSMINLHYYDQQHQWKCKVNGYIGRTNQEFIRYFNPDEEGVSFSKSIRYNVRKAARLNPVYCEESSERVLNKLHELLKVTLDIRNDKFKGEYLPYPYKHMSKEAIDLLFYSGFLRLFHIEVDGEIHCVRCALVKEKRMYGLMIAADEFAYKNGLQHFLQYQLINKLHEEKYLYYNISLVDFGEEGLVSYKESLGCMRHKVHGAYTHYLTFPGNLLNPVMYVGRFVQRNKMFKKVVEFGSKNILKRDV